MGKQFEINHFVVDGPMAKPLYDILMESHYITNPDAVGGNIEIEVAYSDGVLRIDEYTEANSLMSEVLCFFVGAGNIYYLSEYGEDGVVKTYDICDQEGKYFVRPPQTEWEREMESAISQEINDIPF